MEKYEKNIYLGKAQDRLDSLIGAGILADMIADGFDNDDYKDSLPIAIHLVFDNNYDDPDFYIEFQDLWLVKATENTILTLTQLDYDGFNEYDSIEISNIFYEYFDNEKVNLMNKLEKLVIGE